MALSGLENAYKHTVPARFTLTAQIWDLDSVLLAGIC
jgi:hypothetical protein